jgi:hypothetical protein
LTEAPATEGALRCYSAAAPVGVAPKAATLDEAESNPTK